MVQWKSLLITSLILITASCALIKESKVESPSQPVPEPKPQAELFKLPESLPEPVKPQEKQAPALQAEPKKAEPERKPQHLEAVLAEDAKDKFILLNFDNTDIKTVIDTFSELLDMNYILTPGVSGSITIQSYKRVPVSELYYIFQSILEINGLTAVKDGSYYRIVPIDTAKLQPMDVHLGKDAQYKLDSAFVTQLIPLQYVKAADIATILKNYITRGADIIIYEPTNMLIVTAPPATLTKFMKLIVQLDIPDSEADTLKTFVYYVENGEANNLQKILESIYTQTEAEEVVISKTPDLRIRSAQPVGGVTSLPGIIGQVKITAYDDINALIIKCTPRTYFSLLDVLRNIDIPPKQVLIEVMIMEITLTDSFKFGLEWLMKTAGGKGIIGFNLGSVAAGTGASSTVAVPPTVPKHPGSFGAVITGDISGDSINSVITALSTESKLDVLASPHILAMDNKKARIEIGDEVPIATGMNQQPATGGTGTTLISSGQIQYKTIGTILDVKPRITEKDMVTMEIFQEASQLGAKIPVAGQDFQGFSKRSTTTTATVKSGHTLVLGGLIREAKDSTKSGIPFLSKIPFIGFLFSSLTNSNNKTELLLMVTPYVVSDQHEADELTHMFQSKVKTISERIRKND